MQEVMTVQQVNEQKQRIQDLMNDAMKPGVHFGTIPGANKPTLLKPGAETLFLAFGVTVDPEETEFSENGIFRVRVRVKAFNRAGDYLGAASGEASTGEDKYHWRRAVCDQEFTDAPEGTTRVNYQRKRSGVGYEPVHQIKTNPADLANTVLKIAAKRAYVALALQVFAASDIFSQDLEDFDPEKIPGVDAAPKGKPATAEPQPKKKAPGVIAKDVARQISARLKKNKIDPAEFLKVLGVVSIAKIPAARANEALTVINTWGAK